MTETRADEQAWIDGASDRCAACGHLEIFHNRHCCWFCMVPECRCKWDEMSEEDEEE